MITAVEIPKIGQLVRVRQRQYLVEDVVASGTIPGQRQSATLVKLSCIDDDNQGQLLEVLWECELDAKIIKQENWEKIAQEGFDKPEIFTSFLNTLRWNCVSSTDPKIFQAPFRAGIRIDAYQLEPLVKALNLPKVNLFIADDVGLGKTIEAGLIAREMLLRKKIKKIVVSCPPSMLYQWKEELESRFGLTFVILDRNYLMHVRKERGYSTNPWFTHSRFLISHKLLIDDNYTQPLRDWLKESLNETMFILDEAHVAAPSSSSKYAIDSKVTKSVRELSPLFAHRLFLSATPHNGHSNSFSALLEILDPQRFCRGVEVSPNLLEPILVRRLKQDLIKNIDGLPRRNVIPVEISNLPDDAPELVLNELLDKYIASRKQKLENSNINKRIQSTAALLHIGLQQRLLSSIEAFARTLRVHRKSIENKQKQNEIDSIKTNSDNHNHKFSSKYDLLSFNQALIQSDRSLVENDILEEYNDFTQDELIIEEENQFEQATQLTTNKQNHIDLSPQEIDILTQMDEIAAIGL